MLDSDGMGTVSNTVAALDWVAANHPPGSPAVITMSLGVQRGTYTQSMESAVAALVNDHGITTVVAAGNTAGDACSYSPADVSEAFTVGASDLDTKYSRSAGPHSEGVYSQGNQGPCVDIFAPGVDVWSVCGGTRRCGNVTTMTYAYASGTSMAVPHVAGAAALYLESRPTASPGEIKSAIMGAATKGVLDPNALLQGTPNSLLMTRMNQSSLVQAAQGPSG
jgi:subtilisin family serine protease